MKQHHRNYLYRPPRRRKDEAGTGNLRLYLRFLRTYLGPHKWSMVFCMLLVGLNACSVYLMAYYVRIVVDEVIMVEAAPAAAAGEGRSRDWARDRGRGQAPAPALTVRQRGTTASAISRRPPGAGARLFGIFILYVLTLLALNLMARLAQRTQIDVGRSVTSHLRNDMHEKVLALSLSYHKAHNPGQLLARIVSDVEVFQQRMMATLLTASSSVIMVLVGAAILLAVHPGLFLVALAATPLYAAIYRRFRPKLWEINRELRHTNSCLYGLVAQKLDAMKAIQAYSREGCERLTFHRLAACFLRDALGQQRLSAGMHCSAEIVNGLGTGIIFLLGAHFVLDSGMSMGRLMFIYGTAASLFAPVLQLAQLGVVFANLFVILQRLVDVLDRPLEIVDAPDAVPFPTPVKTGLELEHVRFSYSATATDLVLRDVSMRVPAGTWLCVMGASGAGKTTLLYLLARLYDATAGRIAIDGIPLDTITVGSLRRHVGFVPQEAQIFSGTVRDNILYGRPGSSPSEIMAAAKAAELHDFILTLPVQYETTIGEKGASLSGGQRQRLSLARALLTDPEILLLDDCTSALDADTERRIQLTLSRILAGKTAIIVSQRVSMAKRCHQICVLDGGTVSESGKHEELLHAGGFYARLHAQQTE